MVEALQQEQTANVSTRSSRPRRPSYGGAGAKKSHDRNGRGLELRRVWKFYTAKVGTTSIRAKAFGEKIRGRSVILRVGGVRAVCSVHRPPERVERVERAAPAPLCVTYGGRVEAIQAAGLYAPGGERLNHHQKPNKRAAFFLGLKPPRKSRPKGSNHKAGAAVLRLHTTESRRPAARFATPTQGKTNGRPYERSSRKQRIEPLKTQIPNLSTAKVVKSSKEAKHQGRRVEALPCAETSSPAQMIERKEQPPARNRESSTTAESGGGGLVSVFAPPYGEDEPPAFLIGTKPPKRGHENAGKASTPPKPRPCVVLSSWLSLHCKPAPPTSSGGKDRAAPKGQSLNAPPAVLQEQDTPKVEKTD